MLYSIVEVFYSIQGEGFNAGSPAIFIRLAGCNIACPWCDTDHASRYTASADEVVGMVIQASACRDILVVLTGGEPLMQDVFPLVRALRISGYHRIALETNGTLLTHAHIEVFSWVTVSPKAGHPLHPQAGGSELKVVWQPELDPRSLPLLRFVFHYIQPQSEDFAPAIQFVKENPTWKLSVQLHKLLGIR